MRKRHSRIDASVGETEHGKQHLGLCSTGRPTRCDDAAAAAAPWGRGSEGHHVGVPSDVGSAGVVLLPAWALSPGVEARIDSLERRLDTTSDKLDAVRDTLAEVRSSTAVLGSKTDALGQQLEATRQAVEKLAAAIQQLVVAESQNSQTRGELASLKAQVDDLRAWRWRAVGFAAGFGAAGGAVATWAIRVFGGAH